MSEALLKISNVAGYGNISVLGPYEGPLYAVSGHGR